MPCTQSLFKIIKFNLYLPKTAPDLVTPADTAAELLQEPATGLLQEPATGLLQETATGYKH